MNLPILSASQMESISTCARKWGFRYRDGVKAPQKRSASAGTAIHALLERYLRDKILPPTRDVDAYRYLMEHHEFTPEQCEVLPERIGEIAMSGLKFLPLPAEHLKLEHEFSIGEDALLLLGVDWPVGVHFRGVIDCYDEGHTVDVGPGWPRLQDGVPIPLIIDHKTTSDVKRIKTREKLLGGEDGQRGDPQLALYCFRAALDFQKRNGFAPRAVHARWVYYIRTAGKPARAVDVLCTLEWILRTVRQWLPEAIKALEYHAQESKAEDMPASPSGCQKFGGCEYGPPSRGGPENLNVCRLSVGERMRAAMTSTTTPLAQQVSAFIAGGAPSALAAFPPPSTSAAPASAGLAAFGIPAAPAAAPVDPRLAECHPAVIAEGKQVEFLAHCDRNGLDHRTGQPKANTAATLPVPSAFTPPPPAVPALVPATIPSVNASTGEAGTLALARDDGRLVAVQGPVSAPLVPVLTEAPAAAVEAPAEAPRPRGRPKKATQSTTATDVTPVLQTRGPTLLITKEAVQEVIDFLQSLIVGADEGEAA